MNLHNSVKMSSDINLTNNETSGGFLSGFPESSVEMPNDRLNGDCVVHYSGQHDNCELRVMLVNGVREGMGTILKNGAPFIHI